MGIVACVAGSEFAIRKALEHAAGSSIKEAGKSDLFSAALSFILRIVLVDARCSWIQRWDFCSSTANCLSSFTVHLASCLMTSTTLMSSLLQRSTRLWATKRLPET